VVKARFGAGGTFDEMGVLCQEATVLALEHAATSSEQRAASESMCSLLASRMCCVGVSRGTGGWLTSTGSPGVRFPARRGLAATGQAPDFASAGTSGSTPMMS
jgi:hypothetical protein